ncbi:MAG: 3-methyl-2-oxobutanoate hydroxymethyltransferase [Firmicutes bacterium]|nr:3-methyl-2-oxobutanoate hydroxymethyltransferase [Bacillota bacterium]
MSATKRVRVPDLLEKKRAGEKITMLTAYDYTMARLVDEAGIDSILVGDSLGNVMLGYSTTLPVTLDDMIHHAKAVRRGTERALLVVDMPFLTYEVSPEKALENAGRIMREAEVDAVKLEGGAEMAPVVKRMTETGIPVIGHLGMTPQSVHVFGGYRVQGRGAEAAERLIEDALSLQEAGAFAVVLEMVPASLARRVTETLTIPTIGIGAGPDCDGQVLVLQDMLGMYEDLQPRFVKQYANLGEVIRKAVGSYIEEVKSGVFPSEQHTYGD